MRCRTKLILTLVVVAPLTAVPLVSASADSSTTVALTDELEAWYQVLPANPCNFPVGCAPQEAPPPDTTTLHVAARAGQPGAITYVMPDASGLPFGATVESAQMTLPLSTSTQAPSVNAAAASFEACLATEPATNGARGSTDLPPKYDCKISAMARPTADGNAFTIDLVPFLTAWQAGEGSLGIALVSNTTSPASDFDIAFNTRNQTANGGPIRSTVTFSAGSETEPSASTSPEPGVGPVSTPPLVTVPPAISMSPTTTPVPLPPVVLGSTPVAAAAPVIDTGGFRNAIVTVVPLLLLIAAGWLFHLFTGVRNPSRPALRRS